MPVAFPNSKSVIDPEIAERVFAKKLVLVELLNIGFEVNEYVTCPEVFVATVKF